MTVQDFDEIKEAARRLFETQSAETIADFVREVLHPKNRFIVYKTFNRADMDFFRVAAVPTPSDVSKVGEETIRKMAVEVSRPGAMWKQLVAQLLRHFAEYEQFVDDWYGGN